MAETFDWQHELREVRPSLLAVYIKMLGPEEDELRDILAFVLRALIAERDRVALEGLGYGHALDFVAAFMQALEHLRALSGSRLWDLDLHAKTVTGRHLELLDSSRKSPFLLMEHAACFRQFCDSANAVVDEFSRQTVIVR